MSLRYCLLMFAVVGLIACTDDSGSSGGDEDAGADTGVDTQEYDPDKCTSDDMCASPDRCNFETGMCSFACDDENDCLADEECIDRGDGVTICEFEERGGGCQDDTVCDDGQLCDFVTGDCADECHSHDDCGFGEACYERTDADGNICAPDACTNDEECVDGWLCDVDSTWLCVLECDGHADCPSDQHCVERTSKEGKVCLEQ